eukprot:TCALIF_11342-PA protein Name:"Protein of unknown function" AED:0.59 eAED:0.59 QI:31/0.66/0.75/1/0.66/0.75/4/0/205
MDRVHRNRLEVHRQSIVDDLEVIVISDTLVEKGVISEAQNTSILLEKTEHDQARKLLDILPNQGPDAFGIFVEVLRSDYDWLAEKLESADSDHLKASEDELVQLEILDRLLLKGGVPHQLSHRITREEKYFPDGVFWFRVGMLEEHKLLERIQIFCEKLDAPTKPTSIEHGRTSALAVQQQIFCEKLDAPTKPTSIEHGQEILRK